MADSNKIDEETRVILTKRRSYVLPKSAGRPLAERMPGVDLPDYLKGAKIWQTPDGTVITLTPPPAPARPRTPRAPHAKKPKP
jgi:hypothetical protein